jgi:hypothetical protein
MKHSAFWLFFALAPTVAVHAADGLKVTADRLVADRNTQAFVASGHVVAVSHPYRLMAPALSRDAAGAVEFASPTTVTTCTNDACALHWRLTGDAVFSQGRSVLLRDMRLYAADVPVLWLPFWYQPLNTDYGLRIMPGYTSRWGAYLLTKYVYRLAGDPSGEEGSVGLRGATRLDLRRENGIAVGQSLRWRLGDFGEGFVKGYFAWDEDYDRYSRHWTDSRKWNYKNWGSTVDRDRYGFEIGHRWEATERDTVRLHGAVFSDSHFRYDFLRDRLLANRNSYSGTDGNELAWEHLERAWAAGVSVSGGLNDFYESTSRLPEVYVDVLPMPLPGLPVNYEMQSRVGYLDRRAARYGDSTGALTPFSHRPGPWADYNTFRFETYHRLTAPVKVWDVLSVVPRAGLRATWWGDSGRTVLDGRQRAGTTGDDILRTIAEGGVTFAGRGTAWIDDAWQHLVEPYADVLVQEAALSGDGGGNRPYIFDSLDASVDWDDQFAGRSRNLPYSWYGVTPGLRNAFRRVDEKGHLRTVVDFDVYTTVQFNEAEWTPGDRYTRLAENGKPNVGDDSPLVVPGFRLRWNPADDLTLGARAEYDGEHNRLARSSLSLSHRLDRRFSYRVSLANRHYRLWDYAASASDENLFDPSVKRDEDFNWANYGYVLVEAEHELCDAVAWGPFVRWDWRDGELDEAGAWVDYRTDCLGLRLSLGYENDFVRIDGSERDDDWRVGFYVYLRAIGPDMGDIFGGD